MQTIGDELANQVIDVIRALREENARLREAQRWIPVSERLPKIGERVIVILENDWIKLASWFPPLIRIGVVWKSDNGYVVENVTHWMPLPEPPKEAEG